MLSKNSRRRRLVLPQFSMRTFFALITAGCVLMSMVAYCRHESALASSESAVFQVLLALAGYDQAVGQLPQPRNTDELGRPIGSWRLTVSGYLHNRRAACSAPWDAPVNRQMVSYQSPAFCWSRNDTSCMTNIVAVTGPGTPFEMGSKCGLADLDGDTVLLVEVRNSGVHWMEPGDLDIRTMSKASDPKAQMAVSGNHRGGFFVGFADREVWFLRQDVPIEKLKTFCTIDGAKKHDREKILAPYRVRARRGPP